MIGYSLRLAATTLRSAARPSIGYLDESVVTMRVWPSDLDAFGHMNNGRYLTVMDLGRQDVVVRSGMLWVWLRRGWSPVLGGATIRYKRSLQPLRRYQLHSRVLGWDDRWFYFDQRFTRGERLYAAAVVKGMVLHHGAPVDPAELAVAMGVDRVSPPLPDAVRHANAAEDDLLHR